MAAHDRRIVAGSYLLTLARGLAGAALIAVLAATIFAPSVVIGGLGQSTGAGLGCLFSAGTCGALLLWSNRRPNLPAAHLIDRLSRQMGALFLLCAPMIPAVLVIPDQITAFAVGIPAGLALWAGAWLLLRRHLQ